MANNESINDGCLSKSAAQANASAGGGLAKGALDPASLDTGSLESELLDDTLDLETQSSWEHLEQLFSTVKMPIELAQEFEEHEALAPALPGFRFLRLLGRGGFGRVYLAEDERLGRNVAIKVMNATYWETHEEAAARFLNEARVVATLQHAGIVTLFDVVVQHGYCYLISEYVEGGTLEDKLAAGAMPISQAIQITVQLADALTHAHQRNIVHRDLKPRNILLDLAGHPRIADFGLAIRDDQQDLATCHLAGTLEYLAPEQLPAASAYIDGRTDIWALGVVLYRMLTGRMPFAGRGDALFEQIATRNPKPPRQLNALIPTALDRICLRCLEKQPSDRYSSAADLAENLHRVTQPHSHRGLVAATLAVGAVLCSSLWLVWPRRPAEHMQGVSRSSVASTIVAVPAELSVTSLEVLRYHYADELHGTFLGAIGKQSPHAEFDDDVRITVTFSKPAYAYLLEFSSDGQMYLHSPEQRTAPVSEPLSAMTVPPDSGATLALKDGVGTHVFCVLASQQTLPPFDEWLSRIGSLPWSPTTIDGIWRYSSARGFVLEGQLPDRSSRRERPTNGPPRALEELLLYLAAQAPQLTLEAIAFPVVAKTITVP